LLRGIKGTIQQYADAVKLANEYTCGYTETAAFSNTTDRKRNMGKYVIKGGNRLKGTVTVSGAKNAALGIIAASVMSDDHVRIENVPDVNDIRVMLNAIMEIGGKVFYEDEHTVNVCGAGLQEEQFGTEVLRRIRAGYYFIGALLGKYHYACVPLPGGCEIGARPIDQHIKGFEALGAKVEVVDGVVTAKADQLIGAHIYFDVVSVGATINVMMAATLAQGRTILENVAKEPHIVDVANFLNSMGAKIRGAGTDTIRIMGVPSLHATTYAIIPDQIESGTFMCMAAATRGNIVIDNVIPKHLESITAKLREMGNVVFEYDEAVEVIGGEIQKKTEIKTLPYPGFPTDLQPQITTALCLANGVSSVTESIFESRFKYVDELNKMGASIKVNGTTATVEGPVQFHGTEVNAPDLRAGAALVIAALSAEGDSVIDNVNYILRGYEHFDQKIREIGGQLEFIED